MVLVSEDTQIKYLIPALGMLAVNRAAKRKNLQGIEFGYIVKREEEDKERMSRAFWSNKQKHEKFYHFLP